MPRRRALNATPVVLFGAALLLALAAGGCPDDPPGRPCDGHVDCPAGQRCDADTFFCVEAPYDADADAGADAGCVCASDADCPDPEQFCDGVAACLCDRCAFVERCAPGSDVPACLQEEERCVQCLDDEHCAGHETPESGPYLCDVPTTTCVLAPDAGG